jgi:hypothetical protein
MRKLETGLIAAVWVAVALLMPMSALEPVGGPAATASPRLAVAPCEDGAPRTLIGCVTVSL